MDYSPLCWTLLWTHLKTRARSWAFKARSLEVHLLFNLNHEFSRSSTHSFSPQQIQALALKLRWLCGAESHLWVETDAYVATCKCQCDLRGVLGTWFTVFHPRGQRGKYPMAWAGDLGEPRSTPCSLAWLLGQFWASQSRPLCFNSSNCRADNGNDLCKAFGELGPSSSPAPYPLHLSS